MDILVIDDNELMQHVLCRFIRVMGHSAEPVATLSEARQLAANRLFNLLLVDMRLPDADGPDALRELRMLRGYNDVTAIAISGDSQPNLHEIDQAGFTSYLTKPIEFAELRSWIEYAAEQLQAKNV